MNLIDIIGEALRVLRLNRLRTGLTMLGMIIGVAAVAISKLPSVSAAAPVIKGIAQLNYSNNKCNTSISGVTADFFPVKNWMIQKGRFFTNPDVHSAVRVVVLGEITAKKLFEDEDPIGKTIRISNRPFRVAGVLAPKGQSLFGRDQDDNVFIPMTTCERQITGSQFPGSVRHILVQGKSRRYG